MRLHIIRSAFATNAYGIVMICLQSALACAIMALALGAMVDRLSKVGIESGIAERRLAIVKATDVDAPEARIMRRKEAVARISTQPGVEAAAVMSHVPLSPKDTSFGVCSDKDTFDAAVAAGSIERQGCAMPSAYAGSPAGLKALGIEIIDGRDFNAEDFDGPQPRTAIVTASFGRMLYGNRPIVGQLLQAGPENTLRIVGVVNDVIRPHPASLPSDHDVLFVPEWTADKTAFYLIRSADDAGLVQATTEAARTIARASHRVIVDGSSDTSLGALRRTYFGRDYSLLEILGVTIAGLLVVTTAGIVSLSWLWVLRRRRSIGIRRALGAKRGQIVRQFLIENACIVSVGAALGAAIAVGIGLWVPPLAIPPEQRLPTISIAYIVTVLAGQVAAFVPALRAASIHPAIVTRQT